MDNTLRERQRVLLKTTLNIVSVGRGETGGVHPSPAVDQESILTVGVGGGSGGSISITSSIIESQYIQLRTIFSIYFLLQLYIHKKT